MKQLVTILFCTVVLFATAYAQKDIVAVDSDMFGEGNLNNAIQEKIDAGTLSNTIFQLEPYGYYIIIGPIIVPQGDMLEITAPDPGTTQQTSLPQIVWTASGGVNKDFLIDSYGDLTIKNVWFRYADVGGVQVGSTIMMQDDPVANASGKGEVAYFEGCVFDYSPCPGNAGGAVGVGAKHFKGTFKNCHFRNCIDTHLRYYGRALSFPYQTTLWHNDYVLFENCTFANMGYVYMQEAPEYGDNVHFNHCTFVNVIMHSLESGFWYNMSTTNCLFFNTYMYGDIPAQRGEDDYNGGTARIDSIANFGFEVPFTEQDRHILFTNNSYFLEQWLLDWMYDNPYSAEKRRNREEDLVPVPQPMLSPGTLVFFDTTDAITGQKLFPYMNKANLYEEIDPGFVNAPTNIDSLKDFLWRKWSTNTDANWSWNPESGLNQEWPLPEDLSYTNETLKTAAMGGFPLGDLFHWWPNEYAQWQAQSVGEWANILDMLENGLTSVQKLPGSSVPSQFALNQNYPNPFNPTTQIKYSVPTTDHVSLKVYNSIGQEVATLFDGVQNAGNYVVTFDGTGLAGGIYFYQLQSESVMITKKLVLMK